MKPKHLLLPIIGLLAIVACQESPLPPSPPTISFVSFRNTASNIVIPASNNVVPANFVAEVSSSDRSRVTDVRCFSGGAEVTSGAAYRTACSYSSQSGTPEIRAVATNTTGLTSQATKIVTVDGTPPVATALQVGSTNFDPTTGSNFSATLTLGTTTLLRVNSSGSDVLQTFIERNGKLIASSLDLSTQIEITPQDTTPFTVVFGVVDKAGNVTRYNILTTVNKITGDGVPPVVTIASPLPAASVSGNLIVTINASDSGGIDKVILIANNTPVQEAQPQAGSPSVAIPVDTTKFENGSLTLKAIAIDKSGLSTTSSDTTVNVSNTLTPILSIASPANGATASGAVPVSVNVRQRTPFTYAAAGDCTTAGLPSTCGTLAVSVIDYRGSLVGTKTIATSGAGSTRLFETGPFDLSATESDGYTIQAKVSVVVNAQFITLSDTININTTNTSNLPPALLVQSPLRFDQTESVIPTYRSPASLVFADTTDNSGLASVELRMVCETGCGAQPINALEQYVNLANVSAAFQPLKFDGDATPYLPNGVYTARVVSQDSQGNRNIKEVKLRIDRNFPVAPYGFGVAISGPNVDLNDKERLVPGSATFPLVNLSSARDYRFISWVIDPNGKNLGYTLSSASGTTQVDFPVGFKEPGVYALNVIVQEFDRVNNTSRVDSRAASFVVVKQKIP